MSTNSAIDLAAMGPVEQAALEALHAFLDGDEDRAEAIISELEPGQRGTVLVAAQNLGEVANSWCRKCRRHIGRMEEDVLESTHADGHVTLRHEECPS